MYLIKNSHRAQRKKPRQAGLLVRGDLWLSFEQLAGRLPDVGRGAGRGGGRVVEGGDHHGRLGLGGNRGATISNSVRGVGGVHGLLS